MKVRKFILALGLMSLVGLAACGEVATPTVIPTAAPTVAATDTAAAPTVAATDTTTPLATSTTAGTEATAVGTATTGTTADTTATTEMTPLGTATEAGMSTAVAGATGEATPYSTPTEAGMAGTPAAGTPAAGGTPTLSDPRQVVQDFLTSLQTTPDGSASLPYLSTLEQDRVAAGKSIPTLMGIQNMYQSFTVADAQMTGTVATVRATLNFASGAQMRDFTLNNDSGAWTINSVTPVKSGT